jgi:hypothetical protein
MMEKTVPKIICEKTVNGVTAVRNITTPIGNQGAYAKAVVGVGNPFWWFPSIPAGIVVGADFTGAPICTDDAATNNTLISQISVQPEDVLLYQE